MRILKKHIGRPVDFIGSDEFKPINGVVEKVKNGIAAIRYWSAESTDGERRHYNSEGFVTYIPVRDQRIVEVY